MTRPWLLISWHSTWHFWLQNCNIKKQVIHIDLFLRYSGSVEPPAVSKFIQCRGCMVNVYGESSQIDPNTAYSMTTADALLSNYAVIWPVAMEWNEKCDYPSPTLPRYLNHCWWNFRFVFTPPTFGSRWFVSSTLSFYIMHRKRSFQLTVFQVLFNWHRFGIGRWMKMETTWWTIKSLKPGVFAGSDASRLWLPVFPAETFEICA